MSVIARAEHLFNLLRDQVKADVDERMKQPLTERGVECTCVDREGGQFAVHAYATHAEKYEIGNVQFRLREGQIQLGELGRGLRLAPLRRFSARPVLHDGEYRFRVEDDETEFLTLSELSQRALKPLF